MRLDRPPQGSFSGDFHRIGRDSEPRNTKMVQMRRPCGGIGKMLAGRGCLTGMGSQLRNHRPGKVIFAHTGDFSSLSCQDPSEVVFADLDAAAVFALVPGIRVIDADKSCAFQVGAQDIAGFLGENLLAMDQQAHDLNKVELALADINADGAQSRQQAGDRGLAQATWPS